MQLNKIPRINDKFDLAIFLQILKRNYWVAAILIIMSVVGSFLYLRYTQPLYSTSSIIQINDKDQSTQLLNIEDVYKNEDISKVIELLRSKEFLKRAFSKLPLNVSYYVEGTFLATELYKRSPFTIESNANSIVLYDKPMYIDFIDAENAIISFYNKNDVTEKTIALNQWSEVNGGSIRCIINDMKTINEQKNNYKNNRFYFIINNPQNTLNKHINNLSVSLLNRSAKTIEIAYSGYNAEKTKNIVNTIAQEYLTYEVESKKLSAQNILKFIESQLKVVYTNLDHTERQLLDFKKENKIKGRNSEAMNPFPIHTAKITEFEDELINIEFESVTLRHISDRIANEDNLNIYELIASLTGTRSGSVIINVLNNIQQLLNQKEELLNNVTPDNLKIKLIEKQIEHQKLLLSDFITSTITKLEERKLEYTSRLNNYEQKIFNDKNYDELEYSKLERLYAINEGFYHKLIEKKAEYLISQAGFVSNTTILEMAETPKWQISPISKQIYPIFILIGLFSGAAYILIRYLLYDEITSASIIQNYTNAPILGTVPIYKKNIPVSQLLVNKKPNSVFTEAFRTIRSNLQFISHGAETKIITVSSTISGEGKTFVSINLAGIIAINGRKVIIIDLDLRKPRIHLGFNAPNDKGISTILIGKHTLNECIQQSDLKNFDYITSGPVPPNPAELASGTSMENLLSELEDIYDVVIIDTPPVGIVTDALANLQRANYPIYVMKANVSKRHFIDNINSLISEKKMDNLSIILNGVSVQNKRYGSYGYGYGYGYGSGYYSDDEEDDEQQSIGKKLTKKIQKLKK